MSENKSLGNLVKKAIRTSMFLGGLALISMNSSCEDASVTQARKIREEAEAKQYHLAEKQKGYPDFKEQAKEYMNAQFEIGYKKKIAENISYSGFHARFVLIEIVPMSFKKEDDVKRWKEYNVSYDFLKREIKCDNSKIIREVNPAEERQKEYFNRPDKVKNRELLKELGERIKNDIKDE